MGPCGLLTAGSVATVLIDYRAIREDEVSVIKGDSVTVVSSNLSRGYLIHRAATATSPAAEGWLPSYCLHLTGNSARKPSAWAFRIRKTSFNKQVKENKTSDSGPGFIEHLNNQSVIVGETAVLTCRVLAGPGSEVVWKGPGGNLLTSSRRVEIERTDDGNASLTIHDSQIEDCGEYYCILANEEGSVSSSARLSVSCK